MPKTLEQIEQEVDLGKVAGYLIESLSLEDEYVEMSEDTRLIDLCDRHKLELERSDLAQILYRLGVPIQIYFANEYQNLSDEGRRGLEEVADYCRERKDLDRATKIAQLRDSKNVDELMEIIDVGDLLAIGRYAAVIADLAKEVA